MSKSSLLVLALGLGAALGLAVPSATATTVGCSDESGLCIDSGDASWAPDTQSKSKDRKKRSTKSAGTLSLTIDGGRGSVFVNGRYVGTAPVSGVEVPSGKNDLHVRDGSTVLANGLLTVGKGASVSITVRHD